MDKSDSRVLQAIISRNSRVSEIEVRDRRKTECWPKVLEDAVTTAISIFCGDDFKVVAEKKGRNYPVIITQSQRWEKTHGTWGM